jgi:hypothetical protein
MLKGSLKERLKNKEELKQRKKKSQNTAIGQSKSVKLKIPAEELVSLLLLHSRLLMYFQNFSLSAIF